MRIVIAGGSGFLGRALSRRLTGDGHEVIVLSRSARTTSGADGARSAAWNPDGSSGPWAQALEGADAVINLSGAGIADKRWSRARKAELRSSRLLSTRSLVRAMETLTRRPPVFLQGSAMGYYGATLDDSPVDESSPPGPDFFGRLAVEWEAEASPLVDLGCRVVFIRTGLVLDTNGGALPLMALPFRLFGGGPMASGRQVLSWIHIADWIAMVLWALSTPTATGAYNATAPNPMTNAEFSRALGRALRRPSWFPVPGFLLRLIVGEMAEAGLIRGQRVVPARALDAGFTFQYPHLAEALAELLSASPRDHRP
jgi:uncharacterized protein (TIGR01777 family)